MNLQPSPVDLEYNAMLTVPEAQDVLQQYWAASAVVTVRMPPISMSYGPSEDEYLDIYSTPTATGAVHIFFHGGFWRSGLARDYAFLAQPLAGRGVLVVVVNYGLCPTVTLDEIVRQCRAATAWVYRHVEAFGGDPGQITLSGHSAGGHLVAMLANTDWIQDHDLPGDLIKGFCAVSGLFDLAPFTHSWLQPVLRLSPEIVLRNSPGHHVSQSLATMRILVAVGEQESEAFHRQSADYLDNVHQWNEGAIALKVTGRNHVDVLAEFSGGVLEAGIMTLWGQSDAMTQGR